MYAIEFAEVLPDVHVVLNDPDEEGPALEAREDLASSEPNAEAGQDAGGRDEPAEPSGPVSADRISQNRQD
jgi:hypothetical protein